MKFILIFIAELIEKNRKIEGLMVEDIITCMKKYNQSENIQRYGLELLGNLTFNHLDNKKRFVIKMELTLSLIVLRSFLIIQVFKKLDYDC